MLYQNRAALPQYGGLCRLNSNHGNSVLFTYFIEVADCSNVDDIALIQDEKINLSFLTKIACDLTKYISVDNNSGLSLNALPVRMVRPQDNLSKLSSLVSV